MDKQEFGNWAAFNKFELDAEEEARLFCEFEDLLLALDALSRADFGDTPALVHVNGAEPVYREDRAEQVVSREQILANAPQRAENCFTVPRVAD